MRIAGFVAGRRAQQRRHDGELVVADAQRSGQRDRRRQAPARLFDRDAAVGAEPGRRRGPRQRDREIERDRQRRIQIAAAQARAHRPVGIELGQVGADAFDAPVVVADATVDDAQAVGQGRDAGFGRGRAAGQPMLQRGQVQQRRVEFDPLHGELLAAAADRRPRQRQLDAFGAEQRRRGAGLAHDHVAHQQHRAAAQTVFAGAGRGDFQAQGGADAAQDQRRGAVRARDPAQRERRQQRQGGERDERAPPAPFRRRIGGGGVGDHARAGGRAQAPSASGSNASTKASASNTRRSSGRSPMPA
ncbi:hypothetical protein ASD53_01965 [Lysobacter sp. Root559]|nr:hypothetical protein ASD53_01965 [Lysobacter sp. Root559]